MVRVVLLFFLLTTFLSTSAQTKLDSTVVVLEKNNPTTACLALGKLTEDRYLQNLAPATRFDSLLMSMVQQIEKKIKHPSLQIQAIISTHFGEQLILKKNTKVGLMHLNRARGLAQQAQGAALFVYYDRYANVCSKLARVDSALFYSKMLLDHSRSLKNDSLELMALHKVGILCYAIEQYQQACRYFKIITQRGTDEKLLRNSYNTIGLCYRNQKIYDSALFYFDKGLALAQKYDTLYMGLINGNIGDTYSLEGNYPQAIAYLERELQFSTIKRVTKVAVDCMNSLTELYLKVGDLKKADVLYQRLSLYAPGWKDPKVSLNYYKLSSHYYQKKNQYERALHYLTRYEALHDSLASVHNIQRAAEVSAQYDFDHQQREINVLHQQNLLQQAKNRQKNYLLIGIIVITLLIAGLLMALFFNYRQKRKSLAIIEEKNHSLEKVNEELLSSVEKIEEQNQKISELAAHLTEVNASKDKLFSIIGHDLRSPIHSLKGLLKLATSGNLSAEEFQMLSIKLMQSVEHTDFTLNNLLQWARTQMQGIAAVPALIDFNPLIQENINFLADVAQRKHISLISTVAENTVAFADANQVSLVIRNLISNAIKFTPDHGQVVVSAAISDGTVQINVTDSGQGMSEDVMNRLFKIDHHLTTPGTQGEKGSGLGLLLCKEMIEKNHGRIGAFSKPGKGSTFWFALPAAEK